MVDIHSHIVFGVDDGAKDIEQSIKIIKEAEAVGFNKIVATPHYIEGEYECNKLEIADKIAQIKEKLKEVCCNVEILQGNEIYFDENINEFIDQKKATTINNSKYVLFELPMNTEVLNLTEVIYEIMRKGRIPILAHPERYAFVKRNPNALIPLIEKGVIMQCNYCSILGDYNNEAKKTIVKMLQHDMVHVLASDVHRPESAYLKIKDAKEKIVQLIGQEKLDEITTINPEKIVNNDAIDIYAPIEIKKFKLW